MLLPEDNDTSEIHIFADVKIYQVDRIAHKNVTEEMLNKRQIAKF
jgi:hypothetical protein